ncbi:L-asparaginase [Lentzea sp. NBRC 105346]|nr:L-asparaginase [Lentzea sp. NBRC 105346]
MTGSGSGVTPTLGANELTQGLDVGEVTTLATIPGASLTFAILLEVFDWAVARIRGGARGIVVVQGTDTLEETAYFLDCLWPFDEPIVVTGAMRHPGLPGADGPANLTAAVAAAAAANSRGRGALLVLNDEVHAARWVRKAHSSRQDAFRSEPGPLGLVVEQHPRYFHPAHRFEPLPRPEAFPRVALFEATLGDDGFLLREAKVDAAVVAATGVGHVSTGMADAIEDATFPVVVASRTGAGTTFRDTYAFAGSESDLIKRGAVPAGWLDPRKARILLTLALGRDLLQEFTTRGSVY